MPDEDLLARRISQRIDPQTGTIYTEEVYNYVKPQKKVKYFIETQYNEALTIYKLGIIKVDDFYLSTRVTIIIQAFEDLFPTL